MVTSLLYVSRSLLVLPEQAEEIQKIVEVARSRNARLDVTGALIFTEARFAQVLEGSTEAVEELMASIRRDPRHKDVEVVEVAEITSRRFPNWTMAYSGPSFYVDRHIKPLVNSGLETGPRGELASKLIGFMRELSRD